MRLTIKTAVNQSMESVWRGFDQKLFEALSPPFPPVRVVRFDGCQVGDRVILALNFMLFKHQWESLITAQVSTDTEIYFIDEGIRLPFFLKYWRHKHRLVKLSDSQTVIADEIEFKTPFWLTDYLFYPLLWAQFAYRKPVYRSVFGRA